MAMYPSQRKHRANHYNYHQKPSKTAINNLMTMYRDINNAVQLRPVVKVIGVQLKFNF